MVLFGKLLTTETSCLIFKMPAPSLDTMNVYMACPLHVLNPNDFKVKIQVVGNSTTRVSSPLFITVVLFPVQHPFLDLALGVIQNPEVINNTPELKAISYLSVDDSNTKLENSEADVLYANKSGGVSRIPSRILSMNYELGSQEQSVMMHHFPAPGGFIEVELDAKSGLSGGLLITRDDTPSVLGMIIVSSSTSSNEQDGGDCNLEISKTLASKMFYVVPHILQCTSRFYRLTLNDPGKLANLCNFFNMQTFADDALPVVNHLGGDYRNNQQINQMNRFRHITLMNVHNFLSVSPLTLNQEKEANSVRIRTAINTNLDFLDYFFSKQENSVVLIRSAKYFDKIKGVEITIDLNDDMSNILDWCYRGDPLANLELVCQLRTLNNNGEVSLSSQVSFTFLSSETIDRIHGRDYSRRTMQIPGAFFNKLNSFEVLRNFGMAGANVKKLSSRPPGSWYQTCRDWSVNGSTLNARCRRRNQSEMYTSIDITRCNWIRNMDGHLECRDEPGPPPPRYDFFHPVNGGAAMVDWDFIDFRRDITYDFGLGMTRHDRPPGPGKYRSEYFIDYNL